MTFAEIKFDAARIAAGLRLKGSLVYPTQKEDKAAQAKELVKKRRFSANVTSTRAARNQRLARKAVNLLKTGKACTLRQLAEHIGQNLQQTLSVVRCMEDQGKAHSRRMFETLWIARTGVEIPVDEITKDALKKRAERSRKRRHVAAEAKARTSEIIKAMPMGRARPDVGFEALEVWREPQ